MPDHNHTDDLFERALQKVKAHQRGLLGEKQYRRNAVLIPLVTGQDNQPAVLFTKRASTLRRQSGEICFPGGHWEETDENDWATAVRETHEELNIPPETIQYQGALDVVMMNSQMLVFPYVGVITRPELIHPNPDEVEEVFAVDLERLLAMQPASYDVGFKVEPGADFPFHLIPNGQQYAWRTGKVAQLFYEIDGRVIWGLTARILAHFLDIIR